MMKISNIRLIKNDDLEINSIYFFKNNNERDE